MRRRDDGQTDGGQPLGRSDELLRAGKNDRSGGGLLNRRVYYLAKLWSWLTPEWDLAFPPVALQADDLLVDGDDDRTLRDLGVDGTILHTPGHTPDSISVLLDDGTLFCGDAAMNRPLWAGIRYHTIFVTDLDQYYESWRKILESGAETVYPAHGDPFDVERLRENLGAYSQDDLVEADPITTRYDDFGCAPGRLSPPTIVLGRRFGRRTNSPRPGFHPSEPIC